MFVFFFPESKSLQGFFNSLEMKAKTWNVSSNFSCWHAVFSLISVLNVLGLWECDCHFKGTCLHPLVKVKFLITSIKESCHFHHGTTVQTYAEKVLGFHLEEQDFIFWIVGFIFLSVLPGLSNGDCRRRVTSRRQIWCRRAKKVMGFLF